MEFLDPEEKRSKSIKLLLGYALIAFFVIVGTFVISFVLQGFAIFDRQNTVRNGLLFVDSSPGGAKIAINGDNSKTTDARFVLPEGSYELSLAKEGYRDWKKNVDIVGGSVRYHVYPKLFPTTITESKITTLTAAPKLWSQSPDRRWIVYGQPNASETLRVIDTTNPTQSPTPLAVPAAILSPADFANGSVNVVEWSDNSRFMLLAKTLSGGVRQYLIIDRQSPAESRNLSQELALNATMTVSLRNKKYDQYYVLDTATQILRRASLANGIDAQVVKDGVRAYASSGPDMLLCATETGAAAGEYSVRILTGNSDYLLRPIKQSDRVLLDLDQYRGEWVYGVGSASQNTADIYINPLTQVGGTDGGTLAPSKTLNVVNPTAFSLSANARFIGLHSAENFSVYDFETTKTYNYNAPVSLVGARVEWMDGHRYHATSSGYEYVFEYDGVNLQKLAPISNGYFAFYDKPTETMFTLKQDGANSSIYAGLLLVDASL